MAATSAPKVLVVDDEEKIAKLVGGYLEASGYAVALARDGGRALEMFASERPDCVILDIGMPGKDGLEMAREIRGSSSVPIIFLSARAEEIDKVLALELGGDDYVTKPFSPRELTSRVKAVIRAAARAPRDGRARPRSRRWSSGTSRSTPRGARSGAAERPWS
jgi:DNA-binding response OmpR family regulator